MEETRLVSQARTAVALSSLLAVLLFLFTAMTTMLVIAQPDGNILTVPLTVLFLLFSSYMTWAGFWGWGPIFRAFKTGLAQTGCLLLATPMTWVFLILVVGMLLFVVAECYGACGIAIARHRTAVRIANGQLPPQPF